MKKLLNGQSDYCYSISSISFLKSKTAIENYLHTKYMYSGHVFSFHRMYIILSWGNFQNQFRLFKSLLLSIFLSNTNEWVDGMQVNYSEVAIVNGKWTSKTISQHVPNNCKILYMNSLHNAFQGPGISNHFSQDHN